MRPKIWKNRICFTTLLFSRLASLRPLICLLMWRNCWQKKDFIQTRRLCLFYRMVDILLFRILEWMSCLKQWNHTKSLAAIQEVTESALSTHPPIARSPRSECSEILGFPWEKSLVVININPSICWMAKEVFKLKAYKLQKSQRQTDDNTDGSVSSSQTRSCSPSNKRTTTKTQRLRPPQPSSNTAKSLFGDGLGRNLRQR